MKVFYACPNCRHRPDMRAIYTINKRVCPMCGLPIVPQEVERQHNQEVERQRAEAERQREESEQQREAQNAIAIKWVAIVYACCCIMFVLLVIIIIMANRRMFVFLR